MLRITATVFYVCLTLSVYALPTPDESIVKSVEIANSSRVQGSFRRGDMPENDEEKMDSHNSDTVISTDISDGIELGESKNESGTSPAKPPSTVSEDTPKRADEPIQTSTDIQDMITESVQHTQPGEPIESIKEYTEQSENASETIVNKESYTNQSEKSEKPKETVEEFSQQSEDSPSTDVAGGSSANQSAVLSHVSQESQVEDTIGKSDDSLQIGDSLETQSDKDQVLSIGGVVEEPSVTQSEKLSYVDESPHSDDTEKSKESSRTEDSEQTQSGQKQDDMQSSSGDSNTEIESGTQPEPNDISQPEHTQQEHTQQSTVTPTVDHIDAQNEDSTKNDEGTDNGKQSDTDSPTGSDIHSLESTEDVPPKSVTIEDTETTSGQAPSESDIQVIHTNVPTTEIVSFSESNPSFSDNRSEKPPLPEAQPVETESLDPTEASPDKVEQMEPPETILTETGTVEATDVKNPNSMDEDSTTPTDQTDEDSTTPTDQTDEDSTTPTDQTDEDSTTPTDQTDEDSTTPTVQADGDSATPTDQTDEDATTPTVQADEDSATPTDQADEDSATPTVQADEDSTTPTVQAEEGSTSLTDQVEGESTSFTDQVEGESTIPTEFIIENVVEYQTSTTVRDNTTTEQAMVLIMTQTPSDTENINADTTNIILDEGLPSGTPIQGLFEDMETQSIDNKTSKSEPELVVNSKPVEEHTNENTSSIFDNESVDAMDKLPNETTTHFSTYSITEYGSADVVDEPLDKIDSTFQPNTSMNTLTTESNTGIVNINGTESPTTYISIAFSPSSEPDILTEIPISTSNTEYTIVTGLEPIPTVHISLTHSQQSINISEYTPSESIFITNATTIPVSPYINITNSSPSTVPYETVTYPTIYTTTHNQVACVLTENIPFNILSFNRVTFDRVTCPTDVAIFNDTISIDAGLGASVFLAIYKRLRLSHKMTLLFDEFDEYVYTVADFA
nr:protein UL116 [Mastomys natalensis cytomegalovirus 3]